MEVVRDFFRLFTAATDQSVAFIEKMRIFDIKHKNNLIDSLTITKKYLVMGNIKKYMEEIVAADKFPDNDNIRIEKIQKILVTLKFINDFAEYIMCEVEILQIKSFCKVQSIEGLVGIKVLCRKVYIYFSHIINSNYAIFDEKNYNIPVVIQDIDDLLAMVE